MLSGIIGGLWRSSSPSVDEARTTAGSPCTRSLSSAEDLSRARVSLYAVRGNEATELLMSASLFFEDEGESVLVVRGVSEDDSATEKDFRFPCTQIRRVRHHQPEMFQWMLSKGRGGDDVGDEFGLLFERDDCAWLFEKRLIYELCKDADALISVEGSLSCYSRLEKKWRVLCSEVTCRVMQRPHTLEAYLLINDLYGSAASSREESPERTIKTSPSSSSSKDKISTSTAASVTSSHTQRSSAEKTESGRKEKHSYDSSSRSSHTEGSSRGLFSSSSQKNQWQLSLSYDEFIAMDTELLQLQWWGVGTLEDEEGRTSLLSSSTSSSSGGSKGGVESRTLGNEDSLSWGGEKQLYQLRLIKNTQGSSSRSSSSSSQTVKKGAGRGGEERENDEKSKQFFLILQRVMMEAAEGVKVDETAVQTVQAMEASFGYEDTLFDKSIRKNEEENELEWGDAQSEEVTDDENEAAVPLVQRDPTREVWSKCPDTMLYKNMVVGKNRTFVFRQAAQAPHQQTKNTIQVVGFDEYGKTKIVTTVQDNKFDFNSKHVSPAAALLQDGGNKMVLVDENRENAFMMDLEREKIVQKWDADHMTIGGVMPTRKDDLNERTFVAFNPQSIFCMDTRLASNARTHSLSYATKVNFTCGGTDQGGHIATGNAIGDVRLYDGGVNAEGKYKRAKTHLKGLGDPLLHICSLSDGSWVLGTCQKYLVLFPVKLSTNGKTGFVTALGKQKPHPIVLRLRLEDIAHYNLQELNFTKAEFDANETTIVTSTNNLVIIWDFIAVKRGDLFAYSIRKIHDYIKDVAFAKTSVGDSDRVIMATPASVSTKALKKLVR